MPRFRVSLERTISQFAKVVVEAKTEEDAKRIALSEIPEGDLDWDDGEPLCDEPTSVYDVEPAPDGVACHRSVL